MKFIIDANVVIASFIRNGKAAELLINPSLELHAPEFMMEEIRKYQDTIISKTNRSLESLSTLLSEMLLLIKIMPKDETIRYMEEAIKISPDEKDAPYIALALRLNCPIISNDKKLKEQNKVKVYTIHEMIELIRGNNT